MARYFSRRCPECGAIIKNMEKNYVIVGKPFIKCPDCSADVPVNNKKEWKLMSTGQKIRYLIADLPIVVMYFIFGYLFSAMITFLYDIFVVVEYRSFDNTHIFMIGCILVFGLIGVSRYLYLHIYKPISKSNDRMSDNEYISKINSLNEGL